MKYSIVTRIYTEILINQAVDNFNSSRFRESRMHGRGILETRKKFESGRSETDWKKSQLLVESTMFPNNKKVQSEYEKIFGKQEN